MTTIQIIAQAALIAFLAGLVTGAAFEFRTGSLLRWWRR